MKKNIWKKKREKTGISAYEMAKTLRKEEPNLTFDKYIQIEEGKRDMPKSLIEKFMTTINSSKKGDVKMNTLIKKDMVEKWFKENDLDKIIKEYGYEKGKLATVLNISYATLYNALKGKNKVSFEVKEKIYDFFTNELNKIVEPEQRKRKRRTKEEIKMTNESANEETESKEDNIETLKEEKKFSFNTPDNNNDKKTEVDSEFLNNILEIVKKAVSDEKEKEELKETIALKDKEIAKLNKIIDKIVGE